MQFDRNYNAELDTQETAYALQAFVVTGYRAGPIDGETGYRTRLELSEPDESGRLHVDQLALEGLQFCIDEASKVNQRQLDAYENAFKNGRNSLYKYPDHVENLRTAKAEAQQKAQQWELLSTKAGNFIAWMSLFNKLDSGIQPSEPAFKTDLKLVHSVSAIEDRTNRPEIKQATKSIKTS